MFNRYELIASLEGNRIFVGQFMSINKAVKAACFFSDDIHLSLYDNLNDEYYHNPFLRNLCKEFKNGEIYI